MYLIDIFVLFSWIKKVLGFFSIVLLTIEYINTKKWLHKGWLCFIFEFNIKCTLTRRLCNRGWTYSHWHIVSNMVLVIVNNGFYSRCNISKGHHIDNHVQKDKNERSGHCGRNTCTHTDIYYTKWSKLISANCLVLIIIDLEAVWATHSTHSKSDLSESWNHA